jgi:predicted nucleic acid-binding protein
LKTYLDTSFLFSLYANDGNSQSALATIANSPSAYFLSALTELEFLNSVELRVFRKQLSRTEADRIRFAFESDVSRGTYSVFDLDPRNFQDTKSLILRHSEIVGCRTSDILHIAAAMATECDRMFTFDVRQRELARRLKLRTN